MDEAFKQIAWHDFIMFALENKNIQQQFEEATGKKMPVTARSSMDAMIDKATGYQKKALAEYFEAFTEWATVELWGLKFAPKAYREKIEALAGK